MSTLYENADWSQGDLGVVTEPMKVEMIKRYQNILSTERLSYYREEMGQKEKDGLPVSLIDMWGLAIEHLIYGKVLQDTYRTNKDTKMTLSFVIQPPYTHTHTQTTVIFPAINRLCKS